MELKKTTLDMQHMELNSSLLHHVFQYGGPQSIDVLKLYAVLFSRFPNSILEEKMEVSSALRWTKEKYNEALRADWHFKRVLKSCGVPEIDDNLVVLYENLLIYFDVGQGTIRILYTMPSEKVALKLAEQLRFKFRQKEKRGQPRIHFVQTGYNGLKTDSFVLKEEPLDIELNYNDDLMATHEALNQKFEDPHSMGVVLLHGKPGTGKTTYLRHLITQTTRPVLYIPADLATNLGSPAMMRIWGEMPNSVCIIEDAERVLADRGNDPNSPVASLLNLTDGFLAQCFHILFICTFNTALSSIDPALTRKGRLLAGYEFRALRKEKAQQLSDALGYKTTIEQDMTLAELYNQEVDEFKRAQAATIGFINTHSN